MGQRSSIISLVRTAAEEQIENVLLNESGVDLYGVDTESRNALHLASAEGRTRVVSLLLEHANFDVNALDIHGNSALHLAVFKNHDQVAALLLDKGANINLQDANGMTPLHWAVYENNLACVKLLVGRKADQNIFNNKGQTVQSIARGLRKKFREKMLEILPADTPILSQHQDTKDTENMSSSSKQLAGLCTVWGLIKYTHPYLGYRKDINWDNAILEAFREILETEKISEKNYFRIIDKMLRSLKDPNTFIEYEVEGVPVQTQQFVNSADLPAPSSIGDDSNASAAQGDKTQPYVQIFDTDVALVVATHYGQFTKAKVENLKNAFNSAINTANAMVVDIRALQPEDPFYSSSVLLAYIFEEAFRMFLTEDLVLPTKRQSVWNGHPEHRMMSRTFFHGMMVFDAETINASSKSQQHQKIPLKPMTFLINKSTPQRVINIISALQTAHVCTIVYQAEPAHVRPDPDVPGGVLLYEPGVMTSVFDLGDAKVYVRQNEIINPDNSVGFHPDVTVVKGEEFSKLSQVPSAKDIAAQFSDPAVQVAIALVLKKIPSQRRQSLPVIFTKRNIDSPFPDPTFPPPEFRLLGLCRIWNAIQYFYPYKSRISRSLNEILASAIPAFFSATSEIAYSVAIVQVLREIRDSQAYVNSGVLLDHIGTHVPPFTLKTVHQGDVVVAHVLREEAADVDIRPGDVVVSVNGEEVHERLRKLSELFSCSSAEYQKDIRVLSFVLAGPKKSVVKVGIRRVGLSPDGVVQDSIEKEIEIARLLPQKLHQNFSSSPYTILEKIDKKGNRIGYIDLRILSTQNVPDAMECVKDTSSLILDVRGHTKGAGYKLARYLTKKKVVSCVTVTPFFMPSLLVDGAEPSINVSNQSCSPGDPSSLYRGTIVALVDNSTISHGELTCLFLRSCRPDTIFVGIPTHGTMGNITNIILPGNIEVGFPGLGFLASDGSKTQGVVPDVIVQETITGTTEQKDEILEQAVIHLQKQ